MNDDTHWNVCLETGNAKIMNQAWVGHSAIRIV